MKNPPERTIAEIANEFISRSGVTLDELRSGPENQKQEIVWTRAKIASAAHREGWGHPAIGRFLNLSRWSSISHCAESSSG